MVSTFLLGLVFLLPAAPAQEADLREQAVKDVAKLVDSAERAEPIEGRRLLRQAVSLLQKEKLPPADGEILVRQFAKALTKVATAPEDVTAIFGPETRKQMSRQVFYRRHREQWLIEQPVRLLVEFDCRKGQDPRLLSAQPWAP